MKKQKFIFAGIAMILLILGVSFISAFGVSSPFWKGNPLSIYPGETKEVVLYMQNVGSNEDLTVNAEITKGNEIASLDIKDYLVKSGTKDNEVKIKVFVPENVPIGATYQVTLTTKTVVSGSSSGISFGTGMDTTFDVSVVQRPVVKEEVKEIKTENPQVTNEPKNNFGWILSIAIVIIIIIAIVFYMNKKKPVISKNKRKRK